MYVTRPSQLRLNLLHPIFGLALLGLVGCASTNNVRQGNVNFPSDISQPYLTLEQIIDGETDASFKLFHSIKNVLFGPGSNDRLNQPTDMVVDASGRLLIVDSEAGVIAVFGQVDNSWESVEQIVVPGLLHPISIAASKERIFVSDLSGGDVLILDYEFNVLGTINYDGMNRPGSLVYDTHGDRLFVVDPPSNSVFAFSNSGEFQYQLGRHGGRHSLLQRPISMAINPENGDLFILDGIARKVKHYNSEFIYISSFGEYDQVPGSFAFPKGIAFSADGILFISDAAFGNIQLFDPSGALLFFFGETGTGQGEFLMPRNLFMDESQHLFVADPYNNRVQVFQYFAQ